MRRCRPPGLAATKWLWRSNRRIPGAAAPLMGAKQLRLSHSFNQRIGERDLPPRLEVLEAGNSFRTALVPGSLPSTLQQLRLGNAFQQPLRSALPTSLRVLQLGASYDTQFVAGELPQSLRRLVLPETYDKPIARGVLPRRCSVSEAAGARSGAGAEEEEQSRTKGWRKNRKPRGSRRKGGKGGATAGSRGTGLMGSDDGGADDEDESERESDIFPGGKHKQAAAHRMVLRKTGFYVMDDQESGYGEEIDSSMPDFDAEVALNEDMIDARGLGWGAELGIILPPPPVMYIDEDDYEDVLVYQYSFMRRSCVFHPTVVSKSKAEARARAFLGHLMDSRPRLDRY